MALFITLLLSGCADEEDYNYIDCSDYLMITNCSAAAEVARQKCTDETSGSCYLEKETSQRLNPTPIRSIRTQGYAVKRFADSAGTSQ